MKHKYIIGIDEAGRGPLAGPVAVGAVALEIGAGKLDVRKIRDSKQLTSFEREVWFGRMLNWRRGGKIGFAAALVGQKFIDARGIVPAIRLGISRCLERLDLSPNDCLILLDGGLKAPDFYPCQRTIVRGDESEPLIALASIVAKVRRDRRMARLADLYPAYGFEDHKGYGTRAHCRAIRRHGFCPLHRRSFSLNI